ncbi:structural maintenance of chromosomes protein 6-like isoform X2 [Brienomyrus brachyistius]|uniref:structural maintenance of chromosomes protein 6-like isoform X2 n=1 Tax=Brienomyrus brachyistius TaxID=42636 RepID=UPI0020B2B53D|nr:structural maintenance of chromosomes protein 6-like isoform X2 [Brienomyrus brachyistius]
MSKRKSNSPNASNHVKRARSGPREENGEDEDAEDVIGPSQPSSGPYTSQMTSAEVGIVEVIFLKNFMCHSLLGPFAFGPNVNFVIGNNGSGKSAVLTALIVGLGGKAHTTNRGSSLKGFVKEGESSADVSITLRNRGQDAYKPEVFGESIVVELRISSEGLRTYKLRSKAGHLVSTKKEELISILDHFNIQVDNPVSILTQEMSKHFLHSKGEGDKYKFFMKATQLEQMKEDYAYIMKTKTVTQNTIEKHEECLEDLKRKYLEKEDKYKSLASLDEMQTKLEELQNQMAWALVTEMEKEMKPLEERVAVEEKATIKYDQKVEEYKTKVVEAERRYKEIHDQLEGISERVQQLQPQCATLKTEAQNFNRAFKQAEATFHRSKTTLRDLEKDNEQLTRRVDELKHSISQAMGVDSRRRMEKIETLQAELDDLRHKDSTLAQQIEQFQQAVARGKEELGKISCEERELQRSIETKQREHRALVASRTDKIKRFGEQMPALLQSIDEAYKRAQFKQKPVGPLGFCMRLKDPELAMSVESCLKTLMTAFCCDNYRDEKVLQGLMSRHFPQGKRPLIVVSEFSSSIYNICGKSAQHPKYPTVLQALEIDNPVVANCLIDMRAVETVLLIKSNQEARQVMQAGAPPTNCREAFTKDGDQVFFNRYYSCEYHRAQYLSRDVEEQIRHLQSEIENQKALVTRVEAQKKGVEDSIRNNENLLSRAYNDGKKAKDRFRKLQLEMTDLQNVEEPQSEDLLPLEEELQEISVKISSARQERDVAHKKMAKLKKELEEAEQNYRQQKEVISSVAEEADPIKEELSKSDQDVERCKHHKKHYEEKRKAHISGIQKLKADLEVKQKELEASILKAAEICPERLEVRRTAKSLDSEINRLKQKISNQQDLQGDRDEVIKQYQEALENYKNIVMQVKNLKKFIGLMAKIMNRRHKVYTEMRMYLSVRCKYYFDSMLSQRGYTGKMAFDHKNETLAISVQPGEGDKAALSDMRSLSGGERSFSTVCFVLSLWAIAEAPFRCLDEFDVYMDMVNRRISMDMMLKIASSQRYRQFIFLTPQNMSLPDNNLIRIFRLRDPDRTQTVLPFGRRNVVEDAEDQ